MAGQALAQYIMITKNLNVFSAVSDAQYGQPQKAQTHLTYSLTLRSGVAKRVVQDATAFGTRYTAYIVVRKALFNKTCDDGKDVRRRYRAYMNKASLAVDLGVHQRLHRKTEKRKIGSGRTTIRAYICVEEDIPGVNVSSSCY